jgi:putative (di)nucleoside polyphosphate hydrolase
LNAGQFAVVVGVWNNLRTFANWETQVIDREGYRPNVGIILFNPRGELFWARRIGENAWQFPQGGIRAEETPEQALYRELGEEIGLEPGDVEVVGCTRNWLRYRLPKRFVRNRNNPTCIGQKQLWFLLRLVGSEGRVKLDATEKPEFDHWRWVDCDAPVNEVIEFKRDVYQRALKELVPLIRANNR